jgi:dsRNA-specific ribonuclease
VLGEPSEVEAEIGAVYRTEGLEAAFAWIEDRLIPRFQKQEQNRSRRKRDLPARRNAPALASE